MIFCFVVSQTKDQKCKIVKLISKIAHCSEILRATLTKKRRNRVGQKTECIISKEQLFCKYEHGSLIKERFWPISSQVR